MIFKIETERPTGAVNISKQDDFYNPGRCLFPEL